MYIQPDSDIKILHNIPLDADYINTIYFANVGAQTSFFQNNIKYTLADQSYQRVTKGVARVQIKTDNLYDCNYMMFRNTAFGNKWFYAFITSIDYINNVTSEIHYEIDVLQTWHFDYYLNDTFVEREHPATDIIGGNIIPEDLPVGEYVYNDYTAETHYGSLAIIIGIVDTDSQAVDGTLHDGVYGGATLWAFPVSSDAMPNINAKLADYLQAPDSIVSMYMCDKSLITDSTIPITGMQLAYGATGIHFSKSYTAINTTKTLDGYKPKNNKLYTYPYNFFYVDNGKGNFLELRYEYFDNLTPKLNYKGTITQPVEIACRPTGYKNVTAGSGLNPDHLVFDETITLNGYPLCSWNMDTFKAWVAQNSIPIMMDTLKTFTVGAIAGTEKAIDASASSELNKITSVLTQAYKAKIAPDMSKGNFVNGGVNVAHGDMRFNIGRKSVNAQMAKIIDDYFSKFGYACNQLKKPSRIGRPAWNYVKTLGCTIHGSIPVDDEKKICSIYDRGITFWHDASKVGDYSQNNSPS